MSPTHLLTLSVLLPSVGAILAIVLPARFARWVACFISLAALGLVLLLVREYLGPARVGDALFAETYYPIVQADRGIECGFHLGLDGINVWLMALTGLLFVSSVLVSWTAIEQDTSLFYALLLLLETGCLGVFAAQDVLVFYIFFEFTLIPLFFLIGIWGSEERRHAAIKFFLFTLAGSVLTFLGLLSIVLWCGSQSSTHLLTFDIGEITRQVAASPMPPAMEAWIFWALFAGFAIKVPLFPLHTWLPLAHVQAPTAGSVILAGILLKIGTYGFLRFSLPMLPHASAAAAPVLFWLAVAGIVYGAMVALAQQDIKRLIAYSSVSHLGFCMLGIFALNAPGVNGALLQMINHGISTGALFCLVGMLYERYHSRQIADYGGLARQYPWMAFFFVWFTLSSIGLPGLNGFVGEFLILLGGFQRGWLWQGPGALWLAAILALTGVVLGAWYMLWLVQRVFFGEWRVPTHGHHDLPPDLRPREILALAPLAVLVVWIGIFPQSFLAPTQAPLKSVSATAEARLDLLAAGHGHDIAKVPALEPVLGHVASQK